jgi:hypothetical protein
MQQQQQQQQQKMLPDGHRLPAPSVPKRGSGDSDFVSTVSCISFPFSSFSLATKERTRVKM